MVQSGLDRRRLKQAITLILSELNKVKKEGISDKELKSAKDFLRGKLVLELEDSESVADWYGKQALLLNKIYTPSQRLRKISAVTKNDVKKIANQILDDQKLNLALIGPFKNSAEFKTLLKF